MRGRAAPPHPGIYRVPPPPPGIYRLLCLMRIKTLVPLQVWILESDHVT